MDRKARKQQIRELAEEASHAGKSKNAKVQSNMNNSKKQTNNVGIADRDPSEVQKELMKELSAGNVKIVNNTSSDLIDSYNDFSASNEEDDDNHSNSNSNSDNKESDNSNEEDEDDDEGNSNGHEDDEDGEDGEDEKNKNKATKNDDIDMNEFKENVLRFVKTDDLIRQKMEEIKELKNQKRPFEDFILGYLENKNAPFVNIKTGKLIKNKSETKAPLKLNTIKESIFEGIKGEQNIGAVNDIKCNDISDKIIELMEQKRGKNTRTNLKRTFVKKKANKANVKNNKNIKQK